MAIENDNMLLFLRALKIRLQNLSEMSSVEVITRRDLENVDVFQMASPDQKLAIHEMVNDVVKEEGPKFDTGQNNLAPVTNINQALNETNGSDRGNARTFASSHFRNSDDKAA